MTREDRGEPENCPVRGVIDGIGDKWSILILLHLGRDDQRFTGLRKLIPDISQRVLTATLRKLEREGLVWREVELTIPPKVTYGITDLGRSLIEHLFALASWAKVNRPRIDAARQHFDLRGA
ncbi:MAG: transcriptional regulator [Rhizobiales bacterium PAR1]|nr:MAG: transcriptional regulator [Rhizobiales bacterium PAR1]